MNYLPEIIEESKVNIAEAIVNNQIIYNTQDGVVFGTGQVKLTPTETGNVSLKFLAPINMSDVLCLGHGSSATGDTCIIQASATVIDEVEYALLQFDALCTSLSEQWFTFSFSYYSAG